jgi:hypothetical protein
MEKDSQLPATALVLAGKPAYRTAEIRYWYLAEDEREASVAVVTFA